MAAHWEHFLKRWTDAGLIEPAAAARVRAHEAAQENAEGLRWPVLLAIALGGILLGAGVLLFVAAHWEALSPAIRFGLVLLLVAVFHVAGALLADRFPALSTTLHAVGTVSLGAGIFLTGQIFNLQEHWPAALMLWAAGAWLAWALLRDWPQAALAALLTPAWLAGEWIEATRGFSGGEKILPAGLLLLAITYLTAVTPEKETSTRKALLWIGAVAVLPLAAAVPFFNQFASRQLNSLPESYYIFGWTVSIFVPLLTAWRLRGSAAWINVIASLWVITLGMTGQTSRPDADLGMYAAWAVGAVGLVAWGVREARKAWINIGVAGFALTVLFFYFSNVMDKLGRSASLIGLGALFLLGGWWLETMRRRLVARLEQAA